MLLASQPRYDSGAIYQGKECRGREQKAHRDENKSLDEANKTLEAKVANLPAASTTAIVDDKKHEDHEPTAYEQFINAGETARKLYDSLP